MVEGAMSLQDQEAMEDWIVAGWPGLSFLDDTQSLTGSTNITSSSSSISSTNNSRNGNMSSSLTSREHQDWMDVEEGSGQTRTVPIAIK